MSRGPSLYNQNVVDDDDFVSGFVARHDVLETLVRRLETIGSDGDSVHQILIGPRGMGKTSMLRRLGIAINQHPDLAARLIPLNFREEQYNVLRLSDFWQNCGESLAEWAEANGHPDLAARLDHDLTGSGWKSDEAAAGAFAAEMAALNRRPVLLIDNLDLILAALSDEDNWKLRRALQAQGGPIVIGAATQLLVQSAKPDAAFYQFFHTHPLDPLNATETERCMRALARSRGENGTQVMTVLDTQPQRLRTLHALTGGNPRVLALIYRLLESAESDAAMADLEILLDQVTPYYKARVEEYQSVQQRAVIDAVALHWDPITTSDLAQATGIISTTLSPLLDRLRKDGLLEKVATSGSYGGHQMVERFFNIWYLMRHGTRRAKQKMRWLVAFLTCFYSTHELVEIARRARAHNKTAWHRDFAVAFDEAISRGRLAMTPPAPDELVEIDGETPPDGRMAAAMALMRVTVEAFAKRDLVGCENALDELIERFGAEPDEALSIHVARAILFKAMLPGRRAEEAALLDIVLSRLDSVSSASDEVEITRAVALRAKGLSRAAMGDDRGAIEMFDTLLDRYRDTDVPRLMEAVGETLLDKAPILERAGAIAAAEAVENEAIARFGEETTDRLRQYAARALLNVARRHAYTEQFGAAIATYDRAIETFGAGVNDSEDSWLLDALLGKAIVLSRVERNTEALDLYDLLIDRFARLNEPERNEDGLRARYFRALTLEQMGRQGEAVEALDAIVSEFGASDQQKIQAIVADALAHKAYTYRSIDDHRAAIEVNDALVERFANHPHVELQEDVATALIDKAFSLSKLGAVDEELAVYSQVVEQFGERKEPRLLALVAKALTYTGITFGERGDIEREIETYDMVFNRFGAMREPELRTAVLRALGAKSATQSKAGQVQQALDTADLALAWISERDGAIESELSDMLAVLMADRAMLLGQLGDRNAELSAYDDLVRRFASNESPTIRERVFRALLLRSLILEEESDLSQALASYEQLIGSDYQPEDPQSRAWLDNARVRYANLLIDVRGDFPAAERILVASGEDEEFLRRSNLTWLYLLTGRIDEAVHIRSGLDALAPPGLALIDAGIELARDNFGRATDHLAQALEIGLSGERISFEDDLERLLRIATNNGYGESLIRWFEETGFADKAAPLVAAFKGLVRGPDALLDVNPEVRQSAQRILSRLERTTGRKRVAGAARTRRGRPRKQN